MGGGFELYGAEPVQRGVSAAAVVEPFDVLEDRVREFDAGPPALAPGHSTPTITLDAHVGLRPHQIDRTRTLVDQALSVVPESAIAP